MLGARAIVLTAAAPELAIDPAGTTLYAGTNGGGVVALGLRPPSLAARAV